MYRTVVKSPEIYFRSKNTISLNYLYIELFYDPVQVEYTSGFNGVAFIDFERALLEI